MDPNTEYKNQVKIEITFHMRQLLLLFLTGMIIMDLAGQEKKFEIEIHGFVGVDAMHDSRASKTVRHRHLLLYPLAANRDDKGNDINSRGEFDIDATHSRFSLHIKGPSVNGITTFAIMEGDFSGGLPGTDADFLMRHAYIKFGYKKFELITGQTWHPFFIPENFPQTLNAGVGVPIHPLNRNPQLRFIYKPTDKLELSATIMEQAGFRSAGFPKGTEEAELPEFVFQMKAGGTGRIWGSLTAGYKTLSIPYEINLQKDPTNMGSFHYSASLRVKSGSVVFRGGTIYGGNLTEHVMPGGVGRVTSSTEENPKYKPLNTGSYWFDMGTTGKTWDPGFFAGYLKNYGASEAIEVIGSLGRDPNIASVMIFSPRLRYLIGSHVWVGVEYIFNKAAYGNTFTSKGKPIDTTSYVNHRTLLSFKYSF